MRASDIVSVMRWLASPNRFVEQIAGQEIVQVPDGLAGRGELHQLALAAIRAALRKKPGPLSDWTERTAIRELCEQARARGLPAEQVVILLKEAWRELPEARQPQRPAHNARALEDLITVCIDEYYGGSEAVREGG